jgi:hypothetical protein
MQSPFDLVRRSVAIGALIGAATMLAGGAPLAYGAPCDGACNIAPGISPAGPAVARPSTGDPSNNGGGSRGVQPSIPTIKPPPPPVISAQTVVQTAPEKPPQRIPPPEIPEPVIPDIPVYTPPADVVPVTIAPAPVAVAPAVPAEIPILAPPPSAPPAPVVTPVSRVLFTSSAEPRGTQALTLIVLFMACGCWIYGNRIGSQMSARKREHAAAGA